MAEEKKNVTNFEVNLKRLNEIVEKIENNTLPLEESLKLYKEGKTLISNLQDALKEAEKNLKEPSKVE